MKKPRRSRSVPTISRRGKTDPFSKRPWGQVSERIKTKINNAARNAAVAIMNSLAEKGPAYSGDFRDSWQALILGGHGIGQSKAGSYPYSLSDVPRIKITIKAMQRVSIIEILNTSPYALAAMDLVPGKWRKPKGESPIGGIDFGVMFGRREKSNAPTFRWEITQQSRSLDGANALITAKQDWYENYIRGGEMSADVSRVVKLTLRRSDTGIGIG